MNKNTQSTLHLTAMLMASEGRRSKLTHSVSLPTCHDIEQSNPSQQCMVVHFHTFHPPPKKTPKKIKKRTKVQGYSLYALVRYN